MWVGDAHLCGLGFIIRSTWPFIFFEVNDISTS